MSMMVSFCAVLFPRGVLDEILNLIESVSKGFPSYFCRCRTCMQDIYRFGYCENGRAGDTEKFIEDDFDL